MAMTSQGNDDAVHEERRILIVSGLSGAGKSQALKVLEDVGYFCVDNLPLPLLEGFLVFCRDSGPELRRVAVGMDVRGHKDPTSYPEAFSALRSQGHPIEVLFLEADDKTLHARYRETRRPHPLVADGSIPELIRQEREALEPLRESADWVIDTSELSIHDLRRQLIRHFEPSGKGGVTVTLYSFSFRHGIPYDADLVFDVRFLPNPHFVEGLTELDGRNRQVADYVFGHKVSQEFMSRLMGLLEFLLPQYEREGKSYLTIAIGCTGGQHRSVAVVEEIRKAFSRAGVKMEVHHRELS